MNNNFRLEELGTTKGAVKRSFETWYDRPDDDAWSNRVKALLASRRTTFTLDELSDLIDVFNTSHHQCVLDHGDDFSPLVVATHRRLERRLERMQDYIQQRRLADAPARLVEEEMTERCHYCGCVNRPDRVACNNCHEADWKGEAR